MEEDTRKILRMCVKCLPALADIRHGKIQVGLRPYRDAGVRLEHEKTIYGLNIIHCYGHSGSGITLSWGCAKDVVEMIKTFVPFYFQERIQDQSPLHEQLWRLTDERISSKY